MKRRVLALSARALPSRTAQPWTCRRCLAQSAIATTTSSDFIAPPAVPQQSHDIPIPTTFAKTAVPSEPTPESSDGPISQPVSSGFDSTAEADFEARFLDESLPKEYRDRRTALLPFLRRDIRHDLPSQYLTHVDPGALTAKEREQRRHLYKWAMAGHSNNQGEPKQDNAREIKGVVVSAGKMVRTVKVRIPGQRWEPRIKKVSCAIAVALEMIHAKLHSVLRGSHRSPGPRPEQLSR